MTLAIALKLALLVAVPSLVWLLRRSNNPLARKLVVSVGPRTDHANMLAPQVQHTARRFFSYALWSGGSAAFMLFVVPKFTHRTEFQAAAGMACIVLAFLCFVFLVNSAQFALIAARKRTAERRLESRPEEPVSLHPR